MVEVVKKKRIIGFTLGRDAIIIETRVGTSRCIPTLRVGRIGNARIHKQRLISLRVPFLEERPVIGERIAIASDDVVRLDAAHHQIHAREVIGILLEFLGIVLDSADIARTLRHRLADIDEQ